MIYSLARRVAFLVGIFAVVFASCNCSTVSQEGTPETAQPAGAKKFYYEDVPEQLRHPNISTAIERVNPRPRLA